MELLSPDKWKDYELIDCGDFLKLERFGQYITIRPEPQAVGKIRSRSFCFEIQFKWRMEENEDDAGSMDN